MQLNQAQKMFVQLSGHFRRLLETNVETFVVTTAAIAMCGAIYAFYGYRMYKWSLACLGACLGGIGAIYLADVVPIPADNRQYFQISLVVVFGLIGGLIAPRLFNFFTFLLGGGALALALHPMVPLIPQPYGWLALVAGFAAGGFLAFLLQRPTLIVATSIAGTYLCGVALFTLGIHFQVIPKKFNFQLFLGFWIILVLTSVISQFQHKALPPKPGYQAS